MKTVICIGASTQDIFFPTAEGKIIETPEDVTSQRKIAFELGAKFQIDDRFESLGGCAVNQAVGLARLGVSADCYTVVGSDMVGEWIQRELKKENVGMALIFKEDCPSGLSAIAVDKNSGERIIFSNQEANERLEIVPEKLESAEWISISDPNGDWKKTVSEIFEVAKKAGAKIAYNPRETNIQEEVEKVFEFAGKSEVLFVNKDEAIEILVVRNPQLDTQNEKYLLEELKKSGAKVVVLTDGKNGAWASDGEKTVFAEALVQKAKDTTGAGDAFSSGFLAAYIKGKSLEECLQWGTANGGNVVNFYGGVEGLLHENEIDDKIKNIKIENI